MHTKMISSRQCFLLLLFSLMIVGFLAFVPGIYFDGGTDIYTYQVIRGNFTSNPLPFISSFGLYAFSSNVIATLYKVKPDICWFDIMVFLNLVLALFLLLLLLRISRLSIWLYVLFLVPWFDNIFLIELTKTGFWIAFAALLIYDVCDQSQRRLKMVMIILFAYAFMIRAESAFLALICFYLYSVVSNFYNGLTELFIISKRLIPFALIAVLFSILLNINFTPEDKLYESFRPYQFTLWDFGQNPATLKLSDDKDSIAIAAAQEHFISDTAQINSAFFERVGLHKKDKTLLSASAYFESSAYMLKRAIGGIESAKSYFLSGVAFTLAFMLCLIISEQSRKKRESIIAVVLMCSVLILFLCIFMKLERHVIIPLVMGAVLYILIFISLQRQVRSWQKFILIVGSVILTYNSYCQYELQTVSAQASKQLSVDVQKRFPEVIIYIDLYSMVKMHDRLFERDDFPYSRTLSFDNAVISYYPQWQEKMLQVGQSANMKELASNFASNPGKTIFIFNKGREQLFQRYFSVVYGKDVIFEKVPSSFSMDTHYPFSYFRVMHQKHPASE